MLARHDLHSTNTKLERLPTTCDDPFYFYSRMFSIPKEFHIVLFGDNQNLSQFRDQFISF